MVGENEPRPEFVAALREWFVDAADLAVENASSSTIRG